MTDSTTQAAAKTENRKAVSAVRERRCSKGEDLGTECRKTITDLTEDMAMA